MKFNGLKVITIVSTIAAIGSNLLSNYATKKEMDDKIEKEVEKRFEKNNQPKEES